MEIKELISIVRENGVCGAGGAGFPTYAKIDKRANTIILNCAECEPLLKVHRQLLKKYAYEIMNTLHMMAESMEASRVIIAVKKEYEETIQAVKANLDSFKKSSYEGINHEEISTKETSNQKRFEAEMELVLLDEVYPMGDEVVLIYETTKQIVPPGSIPIEIGVAVFNVETVYNVYKAVKEQMPVYDKYLTIAGEVANPITIKVPIGMSVSDVIELAGGVTKKEVVYLMGGPMTGELVEPYEVITKTTNAILVLPKEHYIVNKKKSNTSINMKRAMGICCQCELCTDLCPRFLLGHPIKPHSFMQAATSGVTKDLAPFLDTMYCCSCGICELYACPQDLAPRRLITEYKSSLRKNGLLPSKLEGRGVNQVREYRKIPMERLTSRLNLHSYHVLAPLIDQKVTTLEVRIPLSQHIGAKAISIVKVEDKVKAGDKIGEMVMDKLSIPVHSSITGTIIEVNDKFIRIKANAS